MRPQSKKNIAIVSDAIFPYNIGEKEKRIYELSTRLARKGHKVTIYTMKWWKGKSMRVMHEGVAHEAISPLYPLYDGERRSIKEAILFGLHCFKLLNKKFDVIDIDHMPHLVLFPLKIVCLLKGREMIVTWNEVWGKAYWVTYMGKLGYIAYLVERTSVLLPNRFIAVSEHTATLLRKKLSVSQPIEVIPNGINIQSLKKIKPSAQPTELIYTGRLLKHKNVDRLVTAIATLKKKYPNITCAIVGNGPEERNLKELAKKLKVEKNIRFFDFIPEYNDLYSMIKSAKVSVLPSSREGFGIAAIESHALGVPVVTYAYLNNATKDLIREGENGYLFDDAEHPLDKVLGIALEKKLDRKAIIQSAKDYDWDHIAGKVERNYLS